MTKDTNCLRQRIGHGFDTHRLAPDYPLILGGVEIPFTKGLLAHSDGDAVIHALCDALLGAAGLGDMGHYFPDSDEKFRDIDSRQLLKQVHEQLQARQYQVGNIDITVLAEVPKLSPYLAAMKENLASDLNISVEQVNLKATTSEGMGYVGKGEGIAVHAVVLLAQYE